MRTLPELHSDPTHPSTCSVYGKVGKRVENGVGRFTRAESINRWVPEGHMSLDLRQDCDKSCRSGEGVGKGNHVERSRLGFVQMTMGLECDCKTRSVD